jgi:predicted GNAT family N-acyltransferase
MTIQNCTHEDIKDILLLHQAARHLQVERKMVVWPTFEIPCIKKEIEELRSWKIVVDSQMACTWAITFEDKEIWGEKDQNNSIFLHRICNNPNFRGIRFIDKFVEWAIPYSKEQSKKYIRLDTLGNNTKLIEHYTSAGFDFLGVVTLTNTATLPLHYQLEPQCLLFEMKLD